MKIYTKTGDKGFTSLYDGNRVAKHSINFYVLGEIDELSCRIGMLCSLLEDDNIKQLLRDIQCKLQDFNTYVATVNQTNKKLPYLDPNMINILENNIDYLESQNTKLTKFILPGVLKDDAQSHLCRTQTRKVERYLWEINNCDNVLLSNIKNREIIQIELENFIIPEIILTYINRLSDFFFVLSRWLCHTKNIPDYTK